MTPKEQDNFNHHQASWTWSQFLHGEQGAMITAARIVETVPDLDSKFYGATQVMDEARHVETFARFLQEKVGTALPDEQATSAVAAQRRAARRRSGTTPTSACRC